MWKIYSPKEGGWGVWFAVRSPLSISREIYFFVNKENLP